MILCVESTHFPLLNPQTLFWLNIQIASSIELLSSVDLLSASGGKPCLSAVSAERWPQPPCSHDLLLHLRVPWAPFLLTPGLPRTAVCSPPPPETQERPETVPPAVWWPQPLWAAELVQPSSQLLRRQWLGHQAHCSRAPGPATWALGWTSSTPPMIFLIFTLLLIIWAAPVLAAVVGDSTL